MNFINHYQRKDTDLAKRYILESVAIIENIILAIYNDDGLTVLNLDEGIFRCPEVLIPLLSEIDTEKLHKVLSELLHSVLNFGTDSVLAQDGICPKEDFLRQLLVQKLGDLSQLALQLLLRTAREEASIPTHQENDGSENIINRSCLKSARAGFFFRLLREILTLLHGNDKTHQKLFEDFVKLSFIYIGQRLHFFEFGHSDAGDIEHQIQASAHLDFERLRCKDVQLYSYDLIYLIEILKFSILLAPTFYNDRSNTDRSLTASLSCRLKEAAKINRLCKKRLQRQMAEIALGFVSSAESTEVGSISASTKYQLSLNTINTLGVDEWFKRSLWQLVGWGFLQSTISYHLGEKRSLASSRSVREISCA